MRMTVTGHALERMEQRWPDLVRGLSDEEIARLIQGEVNDALIAGRQGHYCPIELANRNVVHWGPKGDGYYVWLKDKSRGYAVREDNHDGLVVLTTLVGDDSEKARRKLQRHSRR
jgi:hypothetical protein